MRGRHVRDGRVLLLGLSVGWLWAGCAAALDAPTVTSVPGREDLTVLSYRAHVRAGLSDPLTVELPDGVDAALIEVAGDRGQFRLAQLQTPSGRDAVESGGFVTRDAREVDGLVDWLYPNSPTQVLEGGRYLLRFTALGAGGRVVDDEDVTVRLYTRASAGAGGAIKLDVLVADDALGGGGDVDGVAAGLVTRVATLYAQAGMSIADYTAATVHLGASALPLDGGRLSAASLLMLQSALRAGGARADAVHLVVVRGLDDAGDDVAGYSLGLPGPFSADRPTAAVLVSAATYRSSSGALDTDGLGTTAAHEIGHYLGLYHTSERDGSAHDPIGDTPECTSSQSACGDASNVMFWTGGGGRNQLTAGQGVVMRRHPLVVAADPPPLPAADCHGPCNAGDTCVVLGGQSVCATACDPQTVPCDSGRCAPSDDGIYVCRAD